MFFFFFIFPESPEPSTQQCYVHIQKICTPRARNCFVLQSKSLLARQYPHLPSPTFQRKKKRKTFFLRWFIFFLTHPDSIKTNIQYTGIADTTALSRISLPPSESKMAFHHIQFLSLGLEVANQSFLAFRGLLVYLDKYGEMTKMIVKPCSTLRLPGSIIASACNPRLNQS